MCEVAPPGAERSRTPPSAEAGGGPLGPSTEEPLYISASGSHSPQALRIVTPSSLTSDRQLEEVHGKRRMRSK